MTCCGFRGEVRAGKNAIDIVVGDRAAIPTGLYTEVGRARECRVDATQRHPLVIVVAH